MSKITTRLVTLTTAGLAGSVHACTVLFAHTWQMDRHPSAINNIGFADGHTEPVDLIDMDQRLWHKDWPTY